MARNPLGIEVYPHRDHLVQKGRPTSQKAESGSRKRQLTIGCQLPGGRNGRATVWGGQGRSGRGTLMKNDGLVYQTGRIPEQGK